MKKIFLTIPLLVLLSGCGEVQFPESVSTPTPSAVATPQTVASPNASPSSASALEEANLSCTAVQKERDNLAEAVKISQDELRVCKTENTKLSALKVATTAHNDQLEKFAPIIQKYLTETTQKEFPFTLCGTLGKATTQGWYKDFETTLSQSGIQFAPLNRPLIADDLGGVCASEEGKIAIFLGAAAAGKSDFHLLKYTIETKTLEQASLLNGNCGATCPTKFGKRFGPMITLTGKNKEYKYYYDSNVITE